MQLELAAIWVEECMIIKNQGFNLGGQYSYKFEFDRYQNVVEVTIKKTINYIDLFKESGVSNISGIIGKNGTGKTTFFKLLNLIESDHSLQNHANVILIFENKINDHIFISVYKSKRALSHNELILKLSNKSIFSENDIGRNIFLDKISDLSTHHSILFYSSVFSFQNDKYLALDNNFNRSVDYRLRESLSEENITNYTSNYDDKSLLAEHAFDLIKLYNRDNDKRLITFLAAVNTRHKQLSKIIEAVKFPDSITVWFSDEYFKKAHELVKESLYDFTSLTKFYDSLKTINLENKNLIKRFKNEVILNLFYFAFAYDYFSQNDSNQKLEDLELFVKSLEKNYATFEKLEDYLKTQKANDSRYTLSKINNLLFFINENLEEITINSIGSYEITITSKTWEFLDKLISITDYHSNTIFSYSITPFSSGEAALIRQFSEFYAVFNGDNIIKDNLIVSIDEGELYFHPEWQRVYIKSLVDFFSYFKREYESLNIQIIISSHSPFVAGDLPNYNLIFLEKDSSGNVKVSDSSSHLPTFGGNIFELYDDGFYLSEFISQFAYEKINEAFKYLRGEESYFKSINEIDIFSKNIGETIISEEIQRQIRSFENQNREQYDPSNEPNIEDQK